MNHKYADNFDCLHGVRVLTAICTVFVHSITSQLLHAGSNNESAKLWKKSDEAARLSGFFPLVNNFFVMSGALTTVKILRDLEL